MTTTRQLPSPAELNKLLDYDPISGKLFWRTRPITAFDKTSKNRQLICLLWNARFSGKEALRAKNDSGYRVGKVNSIHVRSHRVIWAMVHGEWPEYIDHINGVRDDNRIENLRSVSRGENSKNIAKRIDNTSGVVGVSWCSRSEKWQGKIGVDGNTLHLGFFDKKEDAVLVRKRAEIKHGFHEGHGR